MEATGKERAVIDIEATVKAHANMVPHLLAMHCDTVAQFFVPPRNNVKTPNVGARQPTCPAHSSVHVIVIKFA